MSKFKMQLHRSGANSQGLIYPQEVLAKSVADGLWDNVKCREKNGKEIGYIEPGSVSITDEGIVMGIGVFYDDDDVFGADGVPCMRYAASTNSHLDDHDNSITEILEVINLKKTDSPDLLAGWLGDPVEEVWKIQKRERPEHKGKEPVFLNTGFLEALATEVERQAQAEWYVPRESPQAAVAVLVGILTQSLRTLASRADQMWMEPLSVTQLKFLSHGDFGQILEEAISNGKLDKRMHADRDGFEEIVDRVAARQGANKSVDIPAIVARLDTIATTMDVKDQGNAAYYLAMDIGRGFYDIFKSRWEKVQEEMRLMPADALMERKLILEQREFEIRDEINRIETEQKKILSEINAQPRPVVYSEEDPTPRPAQTAAEAAAAEETP